MIVSESPVYVSVDNTIFGLQTRLETMGDRKWQ